MNKVLIVVDMQNDFITGSLANKDAERIVAPIAKYIKTFEGDVIFTLDTHFGDYLETTEGRRLPIAHCIHGTSGWRIADELFESASGKPNRMICKPTFGHISGLDEDSKWDLDKYDSIEVVGTCTDICVISNVLILKAMYPDTPIRVHADMCAGLSKEKHNAALEVMRSCQVEVV